jgi:hypothetical protein
MLKRWRDIIGLEGISIRRHSTDSHSMMATSLFCTMIALPVGRQVIVRCF